MKIEVSNGEIIDKLTILQIKRERMEDAKKLENVNREYDILSAVSEEIIAAEDPLYKALYEINCQLWEIEDRIRELEDAQDFGDEFIQTARAVYVTNDKRAELKKEINIKTLSLLHEEKSY